MHKPGTLVRFKKNDSGKQAAGDCATAVGEVLSCKNDEHSGDCLIVVYFHGATNKDNPQTWFADRFDVLFVPRD